MKCPACEATLSAVLAGAVELDVCKSGCGGIWFDKDELFKFDEKQEFLPGVILELQEGKNPDSVDHNKIKDCPKCEDKQLVRQLFDHENKVEIDQCWTCSGVWMDPGEIVTVRAQFDSFEDRKKAVNLYVDKQLNDLIDSMEEQTKADIIAYREETKNHFRGAIYAFKQLLGLDDPYDNL